MYLCLDCGGIFETPGEYIESHGLDSPPYETLLCCPYCDGDYVETVRCAQCDEWIEGKYVELDDGTMICDNCFILKDVDDLR